MAEHSWRDVVRRHYGHEEPALRDVRPCYSMHFIYEHARRRYVLSRVRKDRRRIPFGFQFTVTEWLSRRTEMVRRAESLTGNPDHRWVDAGPYYWFLRRYTEHDPAPHWDSRALIEDAATRLAELHEIAKNLPGGLGNVPDELAPYHWPVGSVLDNPDKFVNDMMRQGRPRTDVEAVRARLRRLVDEAQHLELGLTGITHQDFRPDNILVNDGAVTEVIDWDLAHEDHYLYDAVLGALHLPRIPDERGLDAAELFVKAYMGAVDVKADDRAVGWMFRYVVTRNIAVSRNPDKWRRLLPVVE